MKSSSKPGKISSGSEVVNISPFGVWILVSGKEYFLDHVSYPWFRNASVADVLNLESPRPGHLYWPQLDVDLHVEALENPHRFPLKAKTSH